LDGETFIDRYQGIEKKTSILLKPDAYDQIFNGETLCCMHEEAVGNTHVAEYHFKDGTGILVGYTESHRVSRDFIEETKTLPQIFRDNTNIYQDMDGYVFLIFTAGGFRVPVSPVAKQTLGYRASLLILNDPNGPKSDMARTVLARAVELKDSIDIQSGGGMWQAYV